MSTSTTPNLLDTPTVLSLLTTLLLVVLASAISLRLLPPSAATAGPVRLLFVWHLADALCHFVLEGGFLYHCFFSYLDSSSATIHHPTPFNFLSRGSSRVYGPQASPSSPLAQLWLVYARADRRWAGVDLGVVSLELITVFFDGPVALYVAYLLARKDSRASFWMIVLATCELYGGFMTFCPEWLTGNLNLDSSNFMYLWVYLVFFNMLWVIIPLYAIWYSYKDISHAFSVRQSKKMQ